MRPAYRVGPESIRIRRRDLITQEQGREAVEEFLALGLRTFDSVRLILEAYELVHRHGCAFDDALYLALAQRLFLRLVTADSWFYRTVSGLPDVIWIGDYPSSVRS